MFNTLLSYMLHTCVRIKKVLHSVTSNATYINGTQYIFTLRVVIYINVDAFTGKVPFLCKVWSYCKDNTKKLYVGKPMYVSWLRIIILYNKKVKGCYTYAV